jgi:predicted metalloprotease
MRWRGRRQSKNIEDRRGQNTSSTRGGFGRGGGFGMPRSSRRRTGMRRAGGGGLSTIIIMVVLFFVLKSCGINPLDMLTGGGQNPNFSPSSPQSEYNDGQINQRQPGQVSTRDEMGQFVATVLAETEDTWNGIFKSLGARYPEPKLVLFEKSIKSACGHASSATGPFYCPGDNKIYIDLSFYGQLERDFGASGDFAKAYVLAHEVGHHVQNVTGILPKFNKLRRTMSKSETNKMSIRVELQADCFAGVWAHYTAQKGLLEKGDLEEALNAATKIGDDAIQRRTQGYVVPESFNHGTSKQRYYWFRRGVEQGKIDACNTFDGDV